MKKIQVGFLMSYDYELLKNSIPPIYNEADEIFIALDKDQKTWSGKRIDIDPNFFTWLNDFDLNNKITIYKDNFYDPALDPMENEVRERKMLGHKMGIGNWLVQIDSDEYFIDFKNFVKELRKRDDYLDEPEKNQIQIAGFFINLYKYVENGILYVDESRNQKFATNYPGYRTGRNSKQRVIYTKNLILHECLSRSEEEIKTKFENWGHSHQVNYNNFITKWRKIDSSNYKDFQDFFYLEPEKWKNLALVKGKSISEISKNLNYNSLMPSSLFLRKKNFGQWFKFLFK
ncbi:MAG: hypothetical protein WB492_01540 [Christiangramia sp.]